MLAAICRDDADQPVYITLKLEPTEGEFWRGQYPDIIPGYYMNKSYQYRICKGRTSFDNKNEDVMTHGGISLEEVIVPFVEVRKKNG